MGWAARVNANAGLPRVLVTRLSGLRVAVDVQHLYRPSKPKDRGTIFRLSDGTTMAEATAALAYAHALADWLEARGAETLRNSLVADTLIGYYSRRNQEAKEWGAHAYLACHVNAGRGSYAAVEAINGTNGVALAGPIVKRLPADFREILTGRVVRLNPHERGEVCIENFPPDRAAVILEPFFGDNPSMQGFFTPLRLKALGESIAAGVADWWERRS